MKKKKRKRTGKRKNLVIRSFFIFIIFIYFMFRLVSNIRSLSAKTIFPEKEYIGDTYNTNAIIIRNEELYKSAGKGNVKYSVKEGERVPSGKHIAQLKLSGDVSTHDQKLQELDRKIDSLKELKKDLEGEKIDKEKTQESMDMIISEIQKSIQTGNYEEAEILKDKLSIYEKNKEDLLGGKDLIEESLKKLEEERLALSKEINKNTIEYYAKDAGIVSFKVDGYEEIYKYSDRTKYNFEDLKEKPIRKNLLDNKVSENNEPIFKIISNYEWYMILDATDIKDVDKLKKGSKLRIASKDKEITGTVDNIKKFEDKITLLLRFNTDFEEFYEKRFVNIDVVRYSYEGYKIPSKAIIEKDKQKGVFIRDISGIIKFRPVNILYKEEDMVYVSTGDENSNIKVGIDDELTKTITKFDEIILNHKSVKEGMIVN